MSSTNECAASPPTLRVVLAEDEPLIRAELRALLAAEPGIRVVAEYRDGIEAIEGIAHEKPDVALLDIQMPGLTGLEVASHIVRNMAPAVHPQIVFVTAHDRHAIEAFELGAVDYVLKPIDETRFRRTVDRVRARHVSGEHGDAAMATRLDALVEQLRAQKPAATQRYLERLVVLTGGLLRVIPLDAVEWIEADDNYARVHTDAGAKLLRETLKSLDTRLDPARFVRVHRSAIVRIDCIRELKPLASGDYELRLKSGARAPLSRRYRNAVLARIETKS